MRILPVLALLLVCCVGAAATERREFLVLHSYSQEYPWTQRQHAGFMRELARHQELQVTVRVEYLDTKRVSYDDAYAAMMARHVAAKYRGYHPDVVYVTDDNALRFALAHLRDLFPDTPVFFSGVNDYDVRDRLDPARTTGVFENKVIAPNLELMRHVDPDARDIVIIGDESETYQAIARDVRAELARQPDIRARFVSERRLDRLIAELRAGDERFAFLTTIGAVVGDQDEALMLEQTISAIVDTGRLTVLSMEDVYLFPGVLGGFVTSGVSQGESAAQLVLRYLAGTPMSDIAPITESPNAYLIDARELERAGFTLPDEIAAVATILNPLPGFYERNQGLIVASLYSLLSMFVLLLGTTLLVVMRKNREIVGTTRELRRQGALMEEIQESLNRAQRIAGMGNWDWRIAEDRVYWSEGIYRLFGLPREQFAASYEAFLARFHPDDRGRVDVAITRALRGEAPYDMVNRIVLPSGEVRMVRENAEIVRDTDGKPERMIGTVIDVTERERTAQALYESEARLRTVIEGLPVVLWMIDREGRFQLCEGKSLAAMGLEPGELVGESLFERYAGLPDYVEDARRALAGETFVCTRTFGESLVEQRYSPLRDASGAVSGAICVGIDVSEREKSQERLAFLANYDPVTSLPNRFLFGDRLAHAMRLADRNKACVGLLFVDLDNFKTINDTLGHAEGDELLKQVASRLSSVVRVVDTVSRLGGDEFTVTLENLVHEDEAARVATEIVEQSSRPYVLSGNEVYVSPSVGIAIYPRDGTSVDTLLMNADAAMYRAKENGRNGFEFFTREINVRAQQRLELGNQLRGALVRSEFSLHYQPKLIIDSGEVIGFEALLRWTDTRGLSTSPAVFVPVLEETGLIVPVGEWVLLQACRWAASLPDTGTLAPSISVNVSARQFRQPNLDRAVEQALAGSGLAANRLELEITESSLVDLEANVQTMDRLKQLGVRLSIDDFGTGYSSLSYLKRFPVDRLKVDASFVHDVAVDPDDAAIVVAIIGLAHHLGLHVVAEGVETEEQLAFLRAQNCDEIQGYLLARPMPGDQAAAWLGDYRPHRFATPPSASATVLRADGLGRRGR